jgi:hypothetical protein
MSLFLRPTLPAPDIFLFVSVSKGFASSSPIPAPEPPTPLSLNEGMAKALVLPIPLTLPKGVFLMLETDVFLPKVLVPREEDPASPSQLDIMSSTF